MASTSCPCCGQRTGELSIQKRFPIAYCGFCGWNVARARMYLVSRRRSLRAVLVVLTLALLPAILFGTRRLDAVVLWAIFPGLLVFLYLLSERKIALDVSWRCAVENQLGRCYPRSRTVPEPNTNAIAILHRMRALAAPREVTFSADARNARFVTKMFPIGLWILGIHELLFPYHPIGLAARTPFQARLAGIFFLALGCAAWAWSGRLFQDKRALKLLREGEPVLGRVTGSLPSITTAPGIIYEFRDLQGRLWCGRGQRVERDIEEDSAVLIFYERKAPQNSAAIAATYYQLTDTSQSETFHLESVRPQGIAVDDSLDHSPDK
jgi:hypothetical protein